MILDEICEQKRGEVAAAKVRRPLAQLKEWAKDAPKPRDFRRALRGDTIRLIAEVKRASPSRGTLLKGMEATDLASIYEECGAAAISVLTDEKFFRGSLDDLVSVRRSVKLPCLRKEFVIDDYQIYEARAATADAILLIVRILSDSQLCEYRELAESLGMGALVECHDADEIRRAIDSGASIIGVNNRDLQTFEVNLNTTLELRKLVPGGKVLVSESGIFTRQHVRILENSGVDAMLVGEALVTSSDVRAKLRELLGRDES
jgi:indole-3-glycerol phosphate synthase